jgi:hypothetical protein
MSAQKIANEVLAELDRFGRSLPISDWAEALELIRSGVRERLDAARDDLRRGKHE